jgi:hypothetical protein
MIKSIDADYVGQFPILSGKVRVTDPCYERDTWCAGVIEDVKKGAWEAYIRTERKYSRVIELMAFHKDIDNNTFKKSSWITQDADIGVDSGQCGIFDDKYYPEKTGEYDDENSFYYKCCLATENEAGVVDYGVVSRSGFGDGSYVCYTLENKERVVGIKIIFIEENDDEEDDMDNDYYIGDYNDEDY